MAYSDPHPPTFSAAAPAAAALPAAQALERLRAQLMQQALSQVLDGVTGARAALPHLAALEVALAEHGTDVIAGLSRPVLLQVCRQLAGLPLPADDGPLLDLQERLLCALESMPEPGTAVQHRPRLHELSDFLTEEKLLVADASYDDFAALAAGFATTQRATL